MCTKQKQKTATKCGIAKERIVAGKTVEIDTMGWDFVICTLLLLFQSSAFVLINVDID